MHGFPSRDGMAPAEFLAACRNDLEKYDTVSFIQTTIEDVTRQGDDFVACDTAGNTSVSKAILIAAGLVDVLPDVPNIRSYYGLSVHHCPYCDGWENRGKRLGVIGSDDAALSLARELLIWSSDVTLFLHQAKPSFKPSANTSRLKTVSERITGLEGTPEKLNAVLLENQNRIPCDSLFFSPAQCQHSPLALRLGCRPRGEAAVGSGPRGDTGIDGLFIAGNVTGGIQMVLAAAAEGLRAGIAINEWLGVE